MFVPRVLIIAGSDSGGGAGIQGDIKTATALGAYAATAITAVTVQNTKGVTRSMPLPPDIVAEQITAVLDDIGADAIKSGMLASPDIVEAVANALRYHSGIPLVVDTVIQAKGGAPLLDEAGVEAMRWRLFPVATVVTPNVPEAEALTGRKISSVDDMITAARDILELGPGSVLLKGGHLPGDIVTDILMDGTGLRRFSGPRLENPATHGTGCALAAAVAVGLAKGETVAHAVETARAFVRGAIDTGLAIGQGTGPINHLRVVRQ